jgi:hypothetical protein
VLINSTDETNGAATPFPQNAVYLFLNMAGEGSILSNYEDFLYALLIHEYAHVLNLSSKRGIFKLFYEVFGNAPLLAAPNTLQPMWMTEGFAVWTESYLSPYKNSGRLHSTRKEMIFRSAFCENKAPRLDELPYQGIKWPLGNIPYLYGGAMMEEIGNQFDHRAVGELSYTMAGTVPYFINTAAHNTFAKDHYDIYDNFFLAHTQKYTPLCKSIQRAGITPSIRLTDSGVYKSALGKSKYGILSNGYTTDKGASLTLLKDGENEEVSKINVFGHNISSFGSLITFSALHQDAKQNKFSKIHLFDYETKEEKVFNIIDKHERPVRIRAPHFSPTGTWMAGVSLGTYKHKLVRISTFSKQRFSTETDDTDLNIETLWNFPEGYRVGTPKVSPDGSKIMFTLKYGKGSNIFIYDTRGRSIKQITFGTNDHETPSWMSKSKIIYSCDKSSIYNIYTLNLTSRKEVRLTRLVGGGFTPIYYNNEIYFHKYTASGYDVHKLSKTAKTLGTKTLKKQRPFALTKTQKLKFFKPNGSKKIGKDSYNSVTEMMPKFWFPYWVSPDEMVHQEIGIFTLGTDPLTKSAISLFPRYETKTKTPLYNISFSNNSYPVNFSLGAVQDIYNYAKERVKTEYRAMLYYPFSANNDHFQNPFTNKITSVYGGYTHVYDKEKVKSSFATLGYQYNTRSKYPESTNYIGGAYFNLVIELYEKSIQSHYNAYSIRSMGQYFFPLGYNIIYSPSLYGTFFSADKKFYALGGVSTSITSSTPSVKPELPGFKKDSIASNTFGALTHDLFFPLIDIYRGPGTYPLFLDKFTGAFSYSTTYLEDYYEKWRTYHSLSASITTHFHIFYHSSLKFKLQGSKGLGDDGIWSVTTILTADI